MIWFGEIKFLTGATLRLTIRIRRETRMIFLTISATFVEDLVIEDEDVGDLVGDAFLVVSSVWDEGFETFGSTLRILAS